MSYELLPNSPGSPTELAAYEQHMSDYAELVEPLAVAVHSGTSPESIPGYLGAGGDKTAFRARHGSDNVVIKFMHYPDDTQRTLESAYPLLQGNGVPHLEQLLALDTHKGVMVTSFLPGKVISEYSSRGLLGIKKRHLTHLDTTLQRMAELGLHPHNNGGILFDKKTGFNFADYTFQDNNGNILPYSPDTHDLLYYALADHKKFDELNAMKFNGYFVPRNAYQTTGLRALVRAAVIKRYRNL